MSITRDEVIRALHLRDHLEDLGFSVVIAGGFARDVYFQEPPKDLDIIVAVSGRESMESVEKALELANVVNQMFHMYNARSDDRLIGGFKCAGNIDVILYNIGNAQQAPEHFDFNLNQFQLKGDTFEDAYVFYVGDTPWHELVAVRQDFSQDRHNKMREKWLNLSYRYPEGAGPARVKLSDGVFHNPEL